MILPLNSIAYAAETSSTKVQFSINTWDAILSASPVVQLTLCLLVGMSIASWTIIITKRRTFSRLKKANAHFMTEFMRAKSLESLAEHANRFPGSPLARIFKAGYAELQKVASKALEEDRTDGVAGPVPGAEEPKPQPLMHGADNVDRALHRAIDIEVMRLESTLTFLATTGSTGHFIGLFGTVWGIMSSFQQIGAMKSASLAVVAPGISEALVATAIGLAAAIPAVMAYNHFITQLRREETSFNNFAADYLNIVKRNFFKES